MGAWSALQERDRRSYARIRSRYDEKTPLWFDFGGLLGGLVGGLGLPSAQRTHGSVRIALTALFVTIAVSFAVAAIRWDRQHRVAPRRLALWGRSTRS